MVVALVVGLSVLGATGIVKIWSDSSTKKTLQAKVDGLSLVIQSLDSKIKLYEQSFVRASVDKAKAAVVDVTAEVKAILTEAEDAGIALKAETQKIVAEVAHEAEKVI